MEYRKMLLVLVAAGCCLSATPRYHSYEDEKSVAIREMQHTLQNIRHTVGNHEAEIRVFEEKLKNLDSIIDSLRDQLSDAERTQKEQLKGNSANLETKIATLDTASKGLVADIHQFKKYANESTTVLTEYKQKIAALEKVIEQQNQNIEHLQAAMRSLMDVLQGKDGAIAISDTVGGRTYRIKAGDSLEKIARIHQTTVQVLKELNHLTNDRIIVGKELKIP